MKRRSYLNACLALPCALSVLRANAQDRAGAAAKPGGGKPKKTTATVRRLPLKGLVRALVPEERLAMIRHEAVEGWMPAMTMEFEIRSPEEFRRLRKGDAIAATVVVRDDGAYWLEKVTITNSAKPH
jgi:Cu/Ag efflux protein CusF